MTTYYCAEDKFLDQGWLDAKACLEWEKNLAGDVMRCSYDPKSRLQKSDADGLFKLMDANVTGGNLKNLVTDKPAPITVAL